jgi:hypothetical protein
MLDTTATGVPSMSRSPTTALIAGALVIGLAPAVLAEDELEPPQHVIDARVLDPGAEPLFDLAYEWTAGQRESTTLELWAGQTASMGAFVAEEHQPVPFSVEIELVVERVEPDGTALIEASITEVDLLQPAADEEARTLLAALETAVGVRVREEYDTKGYVLRSRLIDPLEDAGDSHPARDLAVRTLEGLPMRLPLEPVGVGGSWQEALTTTDARGPQGKETATKRLVAGDADGPFWIDTSTLIDIPLQELPGDEFGVDEPATASGEGLSAYDGRIDLARALPAWTSTYEARMELDVPVGNGLEVRLEYAAAVSGHPTGWDDPTWPLLAEVPEPPAETVIEPQDPAAEPLQPVTRPDIDVVVLDPGGEPRQVLRYRLTEGQVERTVSVMRMGMRTVVDGEWTPWLGLPPMEMAATSTVTDIADDGSYVVEVVYTDVGVPRDPGQLPPEAMEEMEASLASLVGMRQVLRIDDRGRILAAATSLPPGAESAVDPAQLDTITQELIDPLPAEPVGVGARWQVSRRTSDAMGFEAYGSNVLTLEEVLPDGRLRMGLDIDLSADPGPMTLPDMDFLDATIDRFTTDGGGDKTVDLGSVNPIVGRSDGISDYAFTIAFGDRSETTQLQMSVEFEARLVESSRD